MQKSAQSFRHFQLCVIRCICIYIFTSRVHNYGVFSYTISTVLQLFRRFTSRNWHHKTNNVYTISIILHTIVNYNQVEWHFWLTNLYEALIAKALSCSLIWFLVDLLADIGGFVRCFSLLFHHSRMCCIYIYIYNLLKVNRRVHDTNVRRKRQLLGTTSATSQ